MVKRDIGIHRHDAAIRRDVGNGEIRISGFFLGGCGVEVLQRVHHTGADTLIRIVGSGIVDGVGFLVADIRASLFRHGNQVRGGHHVLGIIEVNQTNHRHVRLRKRHRRGQLDGNILRTGSVFDVPHFLVIRNEDAGAARRADRIVNAQQQFDCFLRRRGFAQQYGRDFGLFNALVGVRINFIQRIGAADGFGRAHAYAHAVRSACLIGRMCMGLTAVRADAILRRAVIIAERRVGVAVLGKGVGEAVAAVVHLAGGMDASGNRVEQLVVAVGNILRAGEHRRAVRGEVRTNINSGAGKRIDRRQAECQRQEKREKFLCIQVSHDCHHPSLCLTEGIILHIY